MKTMEMNFTRYKTLLCLFLALSVAVSCNKDTIRPFGAGDRINMRVNIKGGIVTDSNKPSKQQRASVGGSKAASSNGIYQQTINLGDGLSLVAKLVPQQETASVPLKQSAGRGLKAVATPVRNDLPIGTKYRLLVYDEDGNLAYNTDETVTSESSAYEEFALDAKEGANQTTFTFIAYSAGTDDVPDLEGTTLDDFYVTIKENQDKFMHFVETRTFSNSPDDSPHELDVVLWNKLSEITTIVDATKVGENALISVTGAYFEEASHDVDDRATIKILDGEMTYLGTAVDKPIVFNSSEFPGTAVASQPTVLVHDAATDIMLTLGNLEILYNGQTFNKQGRLKDPIPVAPGVKYDLYLELKAWCLVDVSNEEFNNENGTTENVNIETEDGEQIVGQITSSDFTFFTTAGQDLVLNITELDNSFNMEINGTKLSTKEIEFQHETGIAHTARFLNGNTHGDDYSEIWQITNGTRNDPVIRLTINPGGNITMQARRSNGNSQLYPMELYNGAQWNNVTWYTDGVTPNEVRVSQFRTGDTKMIFYITGGVRVVECEKDE